MNCNCVAKFLRDCCRVVILLLAVPCWGEHRFFPKPELQPDSPIAKAIRVIEAHPDTMGRVAKLYQFLRQFPEAAAAKWARETLQQTLLEAGEYQRVLVLGKQMMTEDPLDLFAAERALEAARKLGDASSAEWERTVMEAARRVAAAELPASAVDALRERRQWACKLVAAESRSEERDLYQAVLEAKGKARVEAVGELLRKFPATVHRKQALILQLEAAGQGNDQAMTLAVAESLLEADPSNPAALLAAAQIYLHQRKNLEKVEGYGKAFLATSHGPEQEEYYRGNGHLLLGSLYLTRQEFSAADRELRLAKPYHKGNRAAAVLFFLGYVNYYLERYAVAMAFFEECAALPGEYRQQALDNIANMKQRGRTQ